MKYSFTNLALAAAAIAPAFAVPSMHRHAHAHVKKSNELAQRGGDVVEIVYVTKTVVWEDPAATTSSKPSSSKTSSAPVWTPAVEVVKVTPTPAKSSTKPTTSTSAKAAATSSSSSTSDSSISISASALSKMLALGVCAEGTNAVSSNGGAWIGSDGAYTVQMVNKASEDITVVVWGSLGSWVNVKVPSITISLAKNSKKTVSFANGYSGAFSAIYSDTALVNGQISNTWGECTFTEAGVCDVSREVNMSGHDLSIVGPDCTSDMSTCVFVCDSGNVCTTGYSLLNCSAGSQVGAQSGVDTYGNGGASGGCGWSGKSKAAIVATFS